MEAYTSFAQVYDMFMDNVPYMKWCDYIEKILKEYGISEGAVLDLGCGTGKMTRIMSKKGYDMIGVDLSYDMLDIARQAEYMDSEDMYPDDVEGDSHDEETLEEDSFVEAFSGGSFMEEALEEDSFMGEALEKDSCCETGFEDDKEEEFEPGILYLLQDMRELELYGTVRACYCACDSLNYILEEDEVLTVFERVNEYLDEDGVFIFDINSHYKYKSLLADNTIAENREEGSFIWDNYFDEKEGINEYDLTLFIQKEENSDEFIRFQETHYQKCYELDEIKELLKKAGFVFVKACDAYTDNEVSAESEKITIVARKN